MQINIKVVYCQLLKYQKDSALSMSQHREQVHDKDGLKMLDKFDILHGIPTNIQHAIRRWS